MRPAAKSVSGLTVWPVTFASWRRFTTWAVTLNGLVNPRLGSRRYIGIWPPSKPGLVEPPVRALWPLWPFPEVLPRPEPGPRPTRRRTGFEPGAGRRFEREIVGTLVSSAITAPSPASPRRGGAPCTAFRESKPCSGAAPFADDAGDRAPPASAAWWPRGRCRNGSVSLLARRRPPRRGSWPR